MRISLVSAGMVGLWIGVQAMAAGIYPLGDKMVHGDDLSTWNLRPVVDGHNIAFGDYRFAGTTGSFTTGYVDLYNTQTESLNVLGYHGGTPVVSEIAWVAAWAPWTPQIGLNGDYVGYNTSDGLGGMVYQISTDTYTRVENEGPEWHFADVNQDGTLVIQSWENPQFTSVAIDPTTYNPANHDSTILYRTPWGNEFGQAPRIGGDIMTWNGQTDTTYDKYIRDLSTGETRLIWRSLRTNSVDTDGNDVPDQPGTAPVLITDIAQDGSKLAMPIRNWANRDANNRPLVTIMVYDVATDTWTIAVDQEGYDREIAIDGDWIAWQRDDLNGHSSIWAMNLTTMNPILVAGGDIHAEAPTIDGTTGLIAWAESGVNGDVNQRAIHYTYVPEPAGLLLTSLGGILMIRRRR